MNQASDMVKEKNKRFWKSLKDYYDDSAVFNSKVNEFADGVTGDFNPSDLNKYSRRKFLALLSASAAVAATACSDYRDKGEIIPYTNRPEGVLPGKPNFYASYINGNSVLIKVREGRPINIEGNPDHPINRGKLDAQTPADLLNLYDPERLKAPARNKRNISWHEVDKSIIDALEKSVREGKEIAVISNKITSPTTIKIFKDFKAAYPTAKIYYYELFHENLKVNAWKKCYGSVNIPSISWDKSEVILSLEGDLLAREVNKIENARLFASSKDVIKRKHVSRLYVAEGGMSLTGMQADYRIRTRPGDQLQFVMSLLNEIVTKRGFSRINVDSNTRAVISKYDLNSLANYSNGDINKINYLVDDLIHSSGKSIVYAGETLAESVHIAVNLLNEVLGNTGNYNYSTSFTTHHEMSSPADILRLIDLMKTGKVGAVINFDANPVYHLDSCDGFTDALSNVETIISIVQNENETSDKSHFVLPASHSLESWGDNNSRTGLYELQQPVIAPIFDTRQRENILLTWINGNKKNHSEDAFHKYLMNSFEKFVYAKQNVPVDFNAYWFNSLHDGFVKLKFQPVSKSNFTFSAINYLSSTSSNDDYVLHLQKSYYVGDGKFANNGWLQELPHPVTKITWDNYASVSPATAKDLNVSDNNLIQISSGNKILSIPVYIQSGMADKVVTVELGYGREVVGDVGKGVGFNANKFIDFNSDESPWIIKNISVKKIQGKYKLAATQEHHSLDDTFVKDLHLSRKIIREGTVKDYQANPNFLHEGEYILKGITREHKYTGLKWGMSIDLNKCIACGACVTACNIENNIPVVGKEQVLRGREMQWIRIDRYYSGTPEEPIVSNQPMLCQHCDNAPCENVCPVNATNHSPDGLNQMAYNRCVGTRYCSNNCPYKVRRFNFFNFRDHFADAYYDNELTYLINNPEVTVRSRGVMEKCTFCIQRIMDARSDALKDGRELIGSDVQTACQTVCPGNAIVFGDVNDKESEVSKYREHELGYHVLEELYVKPNVTYIAKLRNTHSEEI